MKNNNRVDGDVKQNSEIQTDGIAGLMEVRTFQIGWVLSWHSCVRLELSLNAEICINLLK